MRIVANGEIVVTGAQNIALGLGVVIAGQQVAVHRNVHGFGSTRLQCLGTALAGKLDGGFLDQILPLIFAIRGLRIQFHYRGTRNITGVLHRYLGGEFILVTVVAHTVERLFKSGVAQTVPKRITDFVRIVPCRGTM